ncbi:flagellin [Sphingomonas sp.]|uniref:flagellin N-terminal helical domain-containing protein n=1 Tax=Sphingomonas sp. TaxID=28214 RepID=UPI003B0042E7
MQISTSLFYDRGSQAMATLTGRADTLQTQIATTKRLSKASDDSVAYTRLQGIARADADAKVTTGNLDLAAAGLATADTTLDAIGSQVQRASELAISARSGSLDSAGRQAIAAELDGILDQLVSLGNTADARGQPLFGGPDGGAAVTRNADGSFSFAGTLPSAIPTSDGQSIQPGDTAQRVFAAGGGDTLSTIAALAAALRSGTDVDAAAATAVTGLAAGGDRVTTVRASLGARAARIELDQATVKQAGIDREALRSGLEDTDITATIAELQKTMTILSATQSSFTKLQGLSLFDYLR